MGLYDFAKLPTTRRQPVQFERFSESKHEIEWLSRIIDSVNFYRSNSNELSDVKCLSSGVFYGFLPYAVDSNIQSCVMLRFRHVRLSLKDFNTPFLHGNVLYRPRLET
ncbi:hypothetical protein Q31b_14440 [Novipirellula aureliae]|uniref:Uncharacterized protein n=1 Tax=Novipirellula aureliae TaxID=2527966 RepID=A0A5C6E4Q3_9BACT|nr:hypothetical protein Q31b_14440 [Novipirellula aureliae]